MRVLGRRDQPAPGGHRNGNADVSSRAVNSNDSGRTEGSIPTARQHSISYDHCLDRPEAAIGHRHQRSLDQTLVRVSDGKHIPVLACEQLQQPVLRVVRVLVLVDEDVAERVLPVGERVGEPLERLDREHQHVVEVDRVRGEQPLLVALVHLGDRLVVERGDAAHVLVGPDQLVLRVRDLAVDAAGREALGVDAEVLEARPHDPHLVGLVVDREGRPVAEPLCLAPQHAPTGGVEGEDPGRACLGAEHPLEALAHLAGRLVRERDREDLVRPDAVGPDQVRHPVGEHPGLPRARAGDDEQRAVDVEDGLALGRVEVGEELLVGCDAHCFDASDGRAGGQDGRIGRVARRSRRGRRCRRRRSSARAPGRNVIPPNSTGTSISPAPALPLGRGLVPSALIPRGRCRSTATSRTQPLTTTPGPAVGGGEAGDHVAEQRHAQRAAAVDDEHAPLARLRHLPLEEDVVLVAADRRDRRR